MEIFYQRDFNQNYMVLPFQEREIGTYEERMILDNSISGLLSVDVRNINGELFFYYNIHSLQSIKTIFEHKLFDQETLIQLFCGITNVWKELGKYLLSPENLFLKPECIYMNLEAGEVFLCFVPYQKVGKETFEELAEFLIDRVNYGEDKAKELVYQYYENVCAGEYDPGNLIEHVMIEEAKEVKAPYAVLLPDKPEDEKDFYFAECEQEKEEINDKFPVIRVAFCMGIILLAAGFYFFVLSYKEILSIIGWSQEDYILIGAIVAVCAVLSMMTVVRLPKKAKGPREKEKNHSIQKCMQNGPEGEIEVGEEYFGETTILCAEKTNKVPELKGMDGDEVRSFILNETPFIIGKLSGKADGILTDSRVSRVHAAIREDSGYYYISDLNSTNGTYVNGNRLSGTESVRLHHFDQICLASVEMIFLEQ